MKAHAHHDGGQQEQRLSQHARLGLDASDTPAEHAEAIDHRGVRIGADERVGHGDAPPVDLAQLHDACQVLEVDLVHDAHPRRHDAEAAKRLLRPAQQHVTLAVTLVLALDVALVCLGIAERVDLHRVIDHEVDRHQRINAHRIAPGARHCRAHGGQVDDRRHAGEVLQQHARRHEGALAIVGRWPSVPARQRLDVFVAREPRPGVADEVLEQDLDCHRQPRHVTDAAVCELRETVVRDAVLQRRQRAETVAVSHGRFIFPPQSVHTRDGTGCVGVVTEPAVVPAGECQARATSNRRRRRRGPEQPVPSRAARQCGVESCARYDVTWL